MPVLLARLEVHPISGPDLLDRAAAALTAPDALDDINGLTEGMGVPRGAGAWSEVHATRRQAGWF
jgi:hypothetical protein